MKDTRGSLHLGQSRSRGHARPSPGGAGPEDGSCAPGPGTWKAASEPGMRASTPQPPVSGGPVGAGRQGPDGQWTGPLSDAHQQKGPELDA